MDQETGSAWFHTAPLLSPLLPHQPSPSSAVSGSRLPPSLPLFHTVAKVISGSSPSLTNGFLHHPKQSPLVGPSHPQPPTSSPHSPRIRVIPPVFIRAMSASQPASERAIQTVSQLCFSHGSGTSQQNAHTVQSWLFAAVATAGVSRQQAPAPAQPTLALSGLRGGGC